MLKQCFSIINRAPNLKNTECEIIGFPCWKLMKQQNKQNQQDLLRKQLFIELLLRLSTCSTATTSSYFLTEQQQKQMEEEKQEDDSVEFVKQYYPMNKVKQYYPMNKVMGILHFAKEEKESTGKLLSYPEIVEMFHKEEEKEDDEINDDKDKSLLYPRKKNIAPHQFLLTSARAA